QATVSPSMSSHAISLLSVHPRNPHRGCGHPAPGGGAGCERRLSPALLPDALYGTASVYINDAEAGLIQDYDDWLEKLAPHEPTDHYRHNRTGEDNDDAHLKRQIMG